MIHDYLIYRESDGAALRYVSCTEAEAPINADAGESYMEAPVGVERGSFYIEDGQPKAKTEFDFILTQRVIPTGYEIRFTGIPVGTTARWPDMDETLEDDGVLVCETPFPGTYYFVFEHPRHYRKEVAVDVAPSS